ncbi:MAG: peptidyl-alpha-hydroxyglycine alpha-amidating lyase family protein [Bryobacteraceae bacterium]
MLLAAAFVSAGFLQFPADFDLGAMSAVAIDSKDRVYVLHRGKLPIAAFDKKGKFLRAWGQDMFKVAHGLRIDREGNIWTTDNGNHLLRKFSPEGKLLATIGEHLKSPDDVVFGRDGTLYVADAGNGRIVKLSPDGKMLASWGKKGKSEGEFAAAHSLSIDARDRIYVADRGNRRVQVFEPDGKFVAAWSGFGQPFGVMVWGRELLVSDGDANTISHLDLSSGHMNSQWGDAATLKLPHLMAFDSKSRLWVAEVNGKRVQIFSRK